MIQSVQLRPEDVWAKGAYGADGTYLGKVEALGYRHRALVRVGVPAKGSLRRGLKFYSVEDARIEGERLILPAAR